MRVNDNIFILHQDIYKDIKYTICFNKGGWFTAYLDVTNTRYNNVDYTNIDLNVYGGLTWGENRYPWEHVYDDKYIIGWDYAHYNDAFENELAIALFGNFDLVFRHEYETHHTLPAIECDCKQAIDQIVDNNPT